MQFLVHLTDTALPYFGYLMAFSPNMLPCTSKPTSVMTTMFVPSSPVEPFSPFSDFDAIASTPIWMVCLVLPGILAGVFLKCVFFYCIPGLASLISKIAGLFSDFLAIADGNLDMVGGVFPIFDVSIKDGVLLNSAAKACDFASLFKRYCTRPWIMI